VLTEKIHLTAAMSFPVSESCGGDFFIMNYLRLSRKAVVIISRSIYEYTR